MIFREFPTDVLIRLNKLTYEVVNDIVKKDPMSKKAYDSYSKFKKRLHSWFEISEKDYV